MVVALLFYYFLIYLFGCYRLGHGLCWVSQGWEKGQGDDDTWACEDFCGGMVVRF
jgi:hypothetical protein